MAARPPWDHLHDEDGCLARTCDAALVLSGGGEVPVHSQALIMHSRFFRRVVAELRAARGAGAAPGELLRIPLDEGTTAEELETMLAYLYHRDAVVESFEDARGLVFLADKFNMPSIIRLCEHMLCSDANQLHFAGFSSSMPRPRAMKQPQSPMTRQSLHEHMDAAKWLGLAERWKLDGLAAKCQAVIAQALVYTDAKSALSAFARLQEHGISLKSIYCIASVLGQCLNNFGRCSCGKVFSSLRCSSCFLDNTPKASMEVCERMIRECHLAMGGGEEVLQATASVQLPKAESG